MWCWFSYSLCCECGWLGLVGVIFGFMLNSDSWLFCRSGVGCFGGMGLVWVGGVGDVGWWRVVVGFWVEVVYFVFDLVFDFVY